MYNSVFFLLVVSFLRPFVYPSSCPYLALSVAWFSRVGWKYPGAAWTAGARRRLLWVRQTYCRLVQRLLIVHIQAKGAIAAKEKMEKTRAEDFEQLRKQSGQRDEQLTTLLQETETRHSKWIFIDHFFSVSIRFLLRRNTAAALCLIRARCMRNVRYFECLFGKQTKNASWSKLVPLTTVKAGSHRRRSWSQKQSLWPESFRFGRIRALSFSSDFPFNPALTNLWNFIIL